MRRRETGREYSAIDGGIEGEFNGVVFHDRKTLMSIGEVLEAMDEMRTSLGRILIQPLYSLFG